MLGTSMDRFIEKLLETQGTSSGIFLFFILGSSTGSGMYYHRMRELHERRSASDI